MPSTCPSLLLVTGFTEGGGLCMEDSRKHCSQPYLNEVAQMEENMTLLHLGKPNQQRTFIKHDAFCTRTPQISPSFELLAKSSSLLQHLFRFISIWCVAFSNGVSSLSLRGPSIKRPIESVRFLLLLTAARSKSPVGKRQQKAFSSHLFFSS